MDVEEAESARFERLKEVYHKVISAILLKGVTEEDAKESFEEVLTKSKRFKEHHLTLVFQRLFMEQVPRNLRLEFQDVCDEFKIATSLQRLDQLSERKRMRDALAATKHVDQASNGSDGKRPDMLVTEAICAKKRARLLELRERLEAESQALSKLSNELEATQNEETQLREKLDNLLVPFQLQEA